jgi:hypothetical protein
MIRSLVPSLLLFLLPFALYFLWLAARRRRSAEPIPTDNRHVLLAAGLGFVLAVAGFVIFTDFSGADPDAVYIPPRYENGVLVPGHFETRTPPK